ncbi:MAG: hypothetical protein ACJ74Y_09250, partial [Bryobacteraceae bacterium]
MTFRNAMGMLGLACVAICGIASTFLGYEMMDKVNERLPERERFQPLGWYWTKSRRLHREYKRLVTA